MWDSISAMLSLRLFVVKFYKVDRLSVFLLIICRFPLSENSIFPTKYSEVLKYSILASLKTKEKVKWVLYVVRFSRMLYLLSLV